MSEERKAKSDLNPGEGTTTKMGSSPRRSKRMSLSSDLCLPKITESGENRHVEFMGKAINEDIGDNGTDEFKIVEDDNKRAVNKLTVDKDKSNVEVSDRRNDQLTHSDRVKRVKRMPSGNGIEEEKPNQFESGKLDHKKEMKVKKDGSHVKVTADEVAAYKQSAIDRLVNENGQDLLNMIDKMKSAHKLDEPLEDYHRPRCTHAKANPAELGKQSDKCMICEISQAAEKLTSVDTNRFLVEILYPHDYYDKYSRSKRKLAGLDTNVPAVQMPIIKPVKVLRKQMFTRPVLQKENTADAVDVPGESKLNAKTVHGSDDKLVQPSDPNPNSPRSRLFGGYDKSNIHSKCGEGTQSMFIVENSYREKPVLKGLKGALRKEHTKEKSDSCIAQSKYEVNSLGMRFALPDYNHSLRNRKPSMTRQVTILSTSAQYPITSPRPFTMFEDRQHRIPALPRTLQRGFTFAGFDNNNSHKMTLPFSNHQREATRINQSVDVTPVHGIAPATAIKYTQTHRPFPSLKAKSHLTPIDYESKASDFVLTSNMFI